jgi:hypothetical protein
VTVTTTQPSSGRTLGRLQAWLPALYYGGVGLLLLLIVTGAWVHIVPGTVGRHIAFDSEGYLLALVLPAWIEFVRPRLRGRPAEWPVTVGVGLVTLAVFVFMYETTSIPGSIKTLNETVMALAFLFVYVQSWRRPTKAVAALCSLVVLGVLLATDHSSLVAFPTNTAEGFLMLILAPIAFDITDTQILRPDRPSPLRVRVVWWALLVLIPLAVVGLEHLHFHGTFGDFIRYASRPQEAFVGMLMIELYFALRLLGRAPSR